MVASLDTGQKVEAETTHGFKPLESSSTPKPSHLKPSKHPNGVKMFFGLSPMVDGVLGRTYREDFENPAKASVTMPVVGIEDKYRTTTLLSPNCAYVFSQQNSHQNEVTKVTAELMRTLDCSKFSYGLGIVCKK
ncbi:hypothetical protein JHK82_016431 [Glycine max]|nr:hypothetical protein JHK87_016372 [Glycine soja]KAG5032863.1 hypothetical protein JHK85_016845 [Glycine max]KAG5149550.1 hypothetical protein JHK82_016431 [Glycine max]